MKAEVDNLRKVNWLIPICLVFISLIAFWGFKFWEHSSPKKAMGTKIVLETVPFANGVVLLTLDKNSLIKASYLSIGFLGWKVQKNTPAMQEVPSNNADISITSMTINNHTFAWGFKKDAVTVFGKQKIHKMAVFFYITLTSLKHPIFTVNSVK